MKTSTNGSGRRRASIAAARMTRIVALEHARVAAAPLVPGRGQKDLDAGGDAEASIGAAVVRGAAGPALNDAFIEAVDAVDDAVGIGLQGGRLPDRVGVGHVNRVGQGVGQCAEPPLAGGLRGDAANGPVFIGDVGAFFRQKRQDSGRRIGHHRVVVGEQSLPGRGEAEYPLKSSRVSWSGRSGKRPAKTSVNACTCALNAADGEDWRPKTFATMSRRRPFDHRWHVGNKHDRRGRNRPHRSADQVNDRQQDGQQDHSANEPIAKVPVDRQANGRVFSPHKTGGPQQPCRPLGQPRRAVGSAEQPPERRLPPRLRAAFGQQIGDALADGPWTNQRGRRNPFKSTRVQSGANGLATSPLTSASCHSGQPMM